MLEFWHDVSLAQGLWAHSLDILSFWVLFFKIWRYLLILWLLSVRYMTKNYINTWAWCKWLVIKLKSSYKWDVMRHDVIEYQALRAVKWKVGQSVWSRKASGWHRAGENGGHSLWGVDSQWRRLSGSEAGEELGCPGLEPSTVWLFLRGSLTARSR